MMLAMTPQFGAKFRIEGLPPTVSNPMAYNMIKSWCGENYSAASINWSEVEINELPEVGLVVDTNTDEIALNQQFLTFFVTNLVNASGLPPANLMPFWQKIADEFERVVPFFTEEINPEAIDGDGIVRIDLSV